MDDIQLVASASSTFVDSEPRTMDFEVKSEVKMAENPEIQSKNGLLYVMPQTLSSTVNKTFIRQQAQRQSYSEGDTMVFDINSGSRYIEPESCMLMFDVTTDGVPLVTNSNYTPFKDDVGGLALIEEVHIHAKSGIELDRIQECNQYQYTKHKILSNSDWWDKWAPMWGGGSTERQTPAAGAPTVPRQSQCGNTTARRIIIPMSLISGLFEPTVKGMKMPAGLISGARIEITLEEFGRAFGPAEGTGNATTYTVTNPIIVMQAHELGDSSQEVLNEISVDNGLEYSYTRVFTTVEPTSATSLNIQIKKAVSQGLRAFNVPILSTDISDQKSQESFKGTEPFTRYQFRIGSQFYPQQRIDTESEGYWTTMACYNKSPMANWFSPALSFDNYVGNNTLTPTIILGSSFESDQRLNLSGQPINNSATLTLEATMVPGGGTYHQYLFLEYVAVARSFLTNVEVKI